MIDTRRAVVVGMSGGMDSSLAALLLKEQGYEPIGITLSLWDRRSRCCSEEDALDAGRVCHTLRIPHYEVCHKTRFQREVVDYFVGEYKSGRTPNPCVVCNEKIKFKMLLSKAMELGAHYVATGHYARVEHDEESGLFLLKRGADRSKDQSYFLATLPQAILRRVLFPVGSMTKEEARKRIAAVAPNYENRPESQEVCFVKDGEQESFLEERIGVLNGEIIDDSGKVVGSHSGIYRYTVGQRRGLGVSGGSPLYVLELDQEQKRIIVGPEELLFKKTVFIRGVKHMASKRSSPVRVEGKIRYGSPPTAAEFTHLEDDAAKLVFDAPQRAITPGQLAVAYIDDTVYASGWIVRGE